ncbi:PD40 domain-containing protein [Tessaracoccus lubricantis]|uniref:PD40 domain-containing protein n=1 Tax=Tessaracoccus lubricantis TaxID=545543 RepID=A0ABP9FAM2_9ACTN
MTQSVALGSGIWSTTIDDTPVSLSVRGSTAVVGGADGHAWFVDLSSGSVTDRIDVGDGLLTVSLSPSGEHLVTTSMAGYALWSCADQRLLLEAGGGWSVRAAWASEERFAVASGRRALVHSADGELLWETEPAASTVTDVAWMRAGRRLVVAAYGEVSAHERHQSRPVKVYPYIGSHLALAISPTGQWICSGNQDASIHIWRARDASELTMSGYPDKVTQLVFDESGRWLAADGAPDITIWDFSGKGPEGRMPLSLRAHDRITAMAWRPGSAEHLASGGDDGTVALWNATAGTPQQAVGPARTMQMDAEIAAVAWAGPERLVAVDRSGEMRVFDVLDLGSL